MVLTVAEHTDVVLPTQSLFHGHNKFLVDLVAGTCGGTAQLMVGHPFDTVKVKLQSQSSGIGAAKYRGPLDAARQTLIKEGVFGIYKGLGAPLATVALFNAVLFSSRGQVEGLLAHKDGTPLTVVDQMVAGIGASLAVCVVATPTELVKCRLQAQGSVEVARERLRAAGVAAGERPLFHGPRAVAGYVWKMEGGPLGLMKGNASTLLREIPGNMAMFGAYEFEKQRIMAKKGLSSPSELTKTDLMWAGGVAGTSFWLLCYPADVIKSKIQIDSYKNPQYKGIADCFKKVWRSEGLPGLYRGFVPCLLRSFPANAACFTVFEAVQSRLMNS